MIVALLRKELRHQAPFALLLIMFLVSGIALEIATEIPDLRPLHETFDEFISAGSEGVFVLFVICFALANGLLVREYDEGTLEYLDSLPVTRTAVFMTKFAVAWGLLVLLGSVTGNVWALLSHGLSRTSLDPSFHLGIILPSLFLDMCLSAVFLSVGLLLAYLRHLSWFIAIILYLFVVLVMEVFPGFAVLDPFELGQNHFEGTSRVIPIRPLLAQLIFGSVCFCGALALFRGSGDALVNGVGLGQRKSRWFLATGLGLAVVCMSVVYLILARDKFKDFADFDSISYPEASTSTGTTLHYSYTYPTQLQGRSMKLMERADAAHETIRTFLGADVGAAIPLDGTGSAPATLGLEQFRSIRMRLSESADPDDLLAILAHETVHVFIDRLSKERLSKDNSHTRFYHEGLASYLEYRFFRSSRALEAQRAVAGVYHVRGQARFELLMDDDKMTTRLGPLPAYNLGEVFVSAVVKQYGDNAPGRVLAAIGRDSLGESLSGMKLWRDGFQAAGYDLDRVIEAYHIALDRLAERHHELIDQLPRGRSAIRYKDDAVGIEVLAERTPEWEVVCRTRQASNTPHRLYDYPIGDGSLFWVDPDDFPSGVLWYQLGLEDPDSDRVVWEEWVAVSLGSHG